MVATYNTAWCYKPKGQNMNCADHFEIFIFQVINSKVGHYALQSVPNCF